MNTRLSTFDAMHVYVYSTMTIFQQRALTFLMSLLSHAWQRWMLSSIQVSSYTWFAHVRSLFSDRDEGHESNSSTHGSPLFERLSE